MNREEILEKSRRENEDEGMAAAEEKGRRMGVAAFGAVFLFILIFNIMNGRDNHVPYAMFCAFIAAEAYPKYQFTKKKLHLVVTITGAIASLLSLAAFVMSILG